jgi:2-iminobutanoate/2-iminopropanoate deaminase
MRQKSLQVDGLKHSAPIPSGCRIGPVLTTSVITGRDPVTNQVPPDADGQVRLCFENLKRLLAAGGLGLADVAKVTCFVADDGIREVINKYWVQCWPDAGKRPARHTINLAPRGGFLIQIDALAVAADA